MSRLIAVLIFISIGLALPPPGSAARAGEAFGLQGLRPPTDRLEVRRDAATNIVVLITRACDSIAKLQKDHPEPAVTRPLALAGGQVNALVLAPLYREHPDLRRLTSAEELQKAATSKPSARRLDRSQVHPAGSRR